MARRQELCRDFQRGNCRYGARCKYLHQLPPQPQQPYHQQNDQGIRWNSNQNTGSNQASFRNRDGYSSQRKQQSQSAPTKEHRCTDPRICKQQIKEDFANEFPTFWRLTSYAHYRSLPNDIVGDVSPEELRAAAYEGAKQGLSLNNVAQRETSMVAAKTEEFDALLRNPYRGPATQLSSVFQPGPFSTSPIVTPFQKSSPFTPFGPPTSFASASPPQVFTQPPFKESPSNAFSFGQPSGAAPFQPANLSRGNANSFAQPANLSSENLNPSAQPTSLLQQSPFSFPPQAVSESVFPTRPESNPTSGIFGSQSPFTFPNTAAAQATVGPPQRLPVLPSVDPTAGRTSSPSISAPVPQTPPPTASQQTIPEKLHADSAVWLKDVWKLGEIPEGEPPQEMRF